MVTSSTPLLMVTPALVYCREKRRALLLLSKSTTQEGRRVSSSTMIRKLSEPSVLQRLRNFRLKTSMREVIWGATTKTALQIPEWNVDLFIFIYT